MDYMRKIVNSDVLSAVFDVPENLRNRKVEILVIPYEHEQKNDESIDATESPYNARGLLRLYRKSSLMTQEDGVWAEVVAEKHEDS